MAPSQEAHHGTALPLTDTKPGKCERLYSRSSVIPCWSIQPVLGRLGHTELVTVTAVDSSGSGGRAEETGRPPGLRCGRCGAGHQLRRLLQEQFAPRKAGEGTYCGRLGARYHRPPPVRSPRAGTGGGAVERAVHSPTPWGQLQAF